MTRTRLLFLALSVALVVPLVTGAFVARAAKDDGSDSLYKYLSVFTEVISLVRQGYVEETDFTTLMVGALDGTTDALDPFSVYVPPESVDAYMKARTVGTSRSGLTLLKDRGYLYAVSVLPGSPAAEADVQVSDVIAEINGEATRTMPLWRAQAILAGEEGAEIALKILHMGEIDDHAFTLAAFDAERVSRSEERGVAVLRVPAFDETALQAVRGHLEFLRASGARQLLVDLQGVTGGNPEIAYEMAGLLIPGELGALKRKDETVRSFDGEKDSLWQGEVAVLVDRSTLGAAEVLATVLRQGSEARLVGERTFGWAGELASAKLSNGGQLVYTRSFYAGADGEVIRGGLQPDRRVTLRDRTTADGEKVEMKALILETGVSLLLGEDDAEERKAA